ncbi:MFS transporter [Rhodopila sp.]|uniref:MFS transporter n=1 Tax=Rhodopila sp. TaxID=2480087 RepID=UPI003D0DFA83
MADAPSVLPEASDRLPTRRSEFARAWTVIVAAAIGVGLGTTGLPIYTTGQFIRPLGDAFGWSRSATAGGLIFLTIGSVLMAPIIGALIDRFGARRVAMTAMVGLCLGYFGLTLNGGSIGRYYLGWAMLAVLGAGTSPIVWTRAVASWFERGRGLALGITLCGTGLVAVVGPGIIGGIIAVHGWKAGFYALSAAQIVIGLPVVFLLFRARDAVSGVAAVALHGTTVRQAMASSRFWRLATAFLLISIEVGGLIVNLPAMLADRGVDLAQASRALGYLGFAIIAGRLSIGGLVDRFPARVVAPIYILLPALSCVLLAQGLAPVPAILLIGLSAGAEVDLLAYLISRYFGMRQYARIYGWCLSIFSAGVGTGPILGGWVHDRTGTYRLALYAFAIMITLAAALIGSLGKPDPMLDEQQRSEP